MCMKWPNLCRALVFDSQNNQLPAPSLYIRLLREPKLLMYSAWVVSIVNRSEIEVFTFNVFALISFVLYCFGYIAKA